ncbi:hypothetical protein BDY19DRAFT_993637 [Irpex rosettiformis]|uniref:Uncharacterized protein n=1 Tax=Irpex rosettiformis TaxID=378272 RepID=A0ACB8U3I9_9APHY|nr:hypothetical protein BDY19DRAFT_993637 [Irpex rosettiformis]
MNRRNRNKAAANTTAKPAQAPKQTSPPVKTTPPPDPTPPPIAKSGPAKAAPQLSKSPSLPSPSVQLRREWKTFEVWLSARRADRDKRVNEKLKGLMSATGKSKLQKQPTDMTSFETTLNQELAQQARTEWLKRLSTAGLNEEDWVDITEQEMKAVELAFTPQEPGHFVDSLNTSSSSMKTEVRAIPDGIPSSPPGGFDWNAPVPGGWDSSSGSAPTKTAAKRQLDSSTPARSSPLSSGWGLFGEKPSLPTPESLWEMHVAKHAPPKPPTPPSATIPPSGLPTPESLWEMHVAKHAPPPPTPPPTEPVSPDALWEASAHKKLPVREAVTTAPSKKGANGKAAKSPTESLWGSASASSPPGPSAPIAGPTYTGSSLESAHNHGYMSPLLIELECDEFPIASQDILTDDLVEESIRQWHQQAAEADIQLRKQLVSMHWAKRDWDELLGSHIQEMERNARTVVVHWKTVCDAEKERRMKEDKQRRLAGIRNVTSGNRRWGSSMSSTPAERTPSPAPAPMKKPSVPEPKKTPVPETKKAQPLRKGAVRKHVATVEDATNSDWEERSATPSLSTDRPKPGRKDAVNVDSLWSKDPSAAKGASGLISSLWGKAPEHEPAVPVIERKKPVGGAAKKVLSSTVEPTRKAATPLSWNEPEPQKTEGPFWTSRPSDPVEDDTHEPSGGSFWGGARDGANSAWDFAMNAINSGKPSVSAKPPAKPSPPVSGPGSFWSNEPSFAKMMSGGAGEGGGLDGRFTPWKPSELEPPDEDDPTTKMANLAMQHLYQTVDTEDDIDVNDARNAMLMYTKAAATSTRKKR